MPLDSMLELFINAVTFCKTMNFNLPGFPTKHIITSVEPIFFLECRSIRGVFSITKLGPTAVGLEPKF